MRILSPLARTLGSAIPSNSNTNTSTIPHHHHESNDVRPKVTKYLAWLWKSRLVLLISLLLFSICAYNILLPSLNSAHHSIPHPSHITETEPEIVSRYFHVLYQAPFPDVTLCKSTLSGLALEYPVPIVLNWGVEFEEDHDAFLRLDTMSRWLNNQPPARDEDIVLVADPYNVWFQLRPEILIKRYLDINEEANQRIKKQMGRSAQRHGVEQTIVFAAQRRCWPWGASDVACSAVPQSPLPSDIYGPDTDVYKGRERYPYANFRQRYLNSGSYIGRLGSLRKLINHAKGVAEAARANAKPERMILQQIFGEQEAWRGGSDLSALWKSPKNREFGIGLDYEGTLFQANALLEGDGDWVRHEGLKSNFMLAGHDATLSDLAELPEDLSRSSAPFHGTSKKKKAARTTWEQVSLYTNLWTGAVPTLIHHNIYSDNLLPLGEAEWLSMWFQSNARTGLSARAKSPPASELAITSNSAEETHWWAVDRPKNESIGAFTEFEDFLQWSEICGLWDSDVFRDDDGPWLDPNAANLFN